MVFVMFKQGDVVSLRERPDLRYVVMGVKVPRNSSEATYSLRCIRREPSRVMGPDAEGVPQSILRLDKDGKEWDREEV